MWVFIRFIVLEQDDGMRLDVDFKSCQSHKLTFQISCIYCSFYTKHVFTSQLNLICIKSKLSQTYHFMHKFLIFRFFIMKQSC